MAKEQYKRSDCKRICFCATQNINKIKDKPKKLKRRTRTKMNTVNLGKVRGDDGASVWIKYASDSIGSNATDIYGGQKYIGVKVAPNEQTGSYKWMKFIGDNGMNGMRCYIRYNTSASDGGATESWSNGQEYIGFKIDNEVTPPATSPISGYQWRKFIDNSIRNAIDATSINISVSSGTKYYFGSTVSGSISGTAEVILTHCAGAITVSGNNAKVYITNSPNLSVTGNRQNVFIDGVCILYDKVLQQTWGNFTSSLGIQGGEIITVTIPSEIKAFRVYAMFNNGANQFAFLAGAKSVTTNETNGSGIGLNPNDSFHVCSIRKTDTTFECNKLGYYANISVNGFSNFQNRGINGLYSNENYIHRVEGLI